MESLNNKNCLESIPFYFLGPPKTIIFHHPTVRWWMIQYTVYTYRDFIIGHHLFVHSLHKIPVNSSAYRARMLQCDADWTFLSTFSFFVHAVSSPSNLLAPGGSSKKSQTVKTNFELWNFCLPFYYSFICVIIFQFQKPLPTTIGYKCRCRSLWKIRRGGQSLHKKIIRK